MAVNFITNSNNYRVFEKVTNIHKYMNNIYKTYYLGKSQIDKIINFILNEFCNMMVIGYDKDKYWCKKYNNSLCCLHLEIIVISIGFDKSNALHGTI